MNSLDYIIIIFLAFFIIKGLINGLIKEVFSILAVVIGALIAYFFSDPLITFFTDIWPEAPRYAPVIYILLFILSAVSISYIGRLLTKTAHFVALGYINRFLGGVFGLLKSMLIILLSWLLFSNLISFFDLTEPEIYANSLIIKLLADIIDPVSILSSDAFNAR